MHCGLEPGEMDLPKRVRPNSIGLVGLPSRRAVISHLSFLHGQPPRRTHSGGSGPDRT